MSSQLVSIIVPCYNVEKYLPKALESVYLQTYTEWECILIDDGSSDNSKRVCLEWAEKDERFKYYYQDNQGLSGARNTGLQKATGDFIYFFDSDDLIATYTIENLVNLISESTDIVFGKCAITEGQNTDIKDFLQHSPKPLKRYTNQSKSLLSLVIEAPFICVAWNRLYKKSFLEANHLLFKRGLLHEDELWLFETLFYTKGIIFNDKPTYYYNVANANSITNNFSIKNLEAYLQIIEYIFKNYYSHPKFKENREAISIYVTHLKIITLTHSFNKLQEKDKKTASHLIKAVFKNTITERDSKLLSAKNEALQYNFKLVELLDAEDIVAYLRYYNSSKLYMKIKKISLLKKAKTMNTSKNKKINKVY